MKLVLEFAELHTPLFLGGKNHGLKLEIKKSPGLTLIYDRTEKELEVCHNGKLAIIPVSNVVSMTPAPAVCEIPVGQELPVQKVPTATHKKVQSAQVSTPTSHVFGEGPGLTGK